MRLMGELLLDRCGSEEADLQRFQPSPVLYSALPECVTSLEAWPVHSDITSGRDITAATFNLLLGVRLL